MSNNITKWNPRTMYYENSLVIFGTNLYLALKSNIGYLPMHRWKVTNAFSSVDNYELIDELLRAYSCLEDTPPPIDITYQGEAITMESEKIEFLDSNLCNWKLL